MNGKWNFQAIATIATAIFAVYVFFVKERPLFVEERVSGNSYLTWSKIEKQPFCSATLDVKFKNDGVKSVDVTKIRVRAWNLAELVEPVKSASFLDFDAKLRAQTPISDVTYDLGQAKKDGLGLSPPLIAHYSSGMSYSASFSWLLPEAKNTRFYARVDLYRNLTDEISDWHFTNTSIVCRNPKEIPL